LDWIGQLITEGLLKILVYEFSCIVYERTRLIRQINKICFIGNKYMYLYNVYNKLIIN